MKPNREEARFALALEKPAEKRAAFLDTICDGDPALRRRLEALLASHDQSATALDAPTAPALPTLELDLPEPPDEAVGQTSGRYKLIDRWIDVKPWARFGLGLSWVENAFPPGCSSPHGRPARRARGRPRRGTGLERVRRWVKGSARIPASPPGSPALAQMDHEAGPRKIPACV